jgi:hypothetical protein
MGPRTGVWCVRFLFLLHSLHWKFRSTRRWGCQTHFGNVLSNALNRSRLTVMWPDVMAVLEMSRELASPCGIDVTLWNSLGVMPLLQWRDDVLKLAYETRVYDTRPQNARARLHSDEGSVTTTSFHSSLSTLFLLNHHFVSYYGYSKFCVIKFGDKRAFLLLVKCFCTSFQRIFLSK